MTLKLDFIDSLHARFDLENSLRYYILISAMGDWHLSGFSKHCCGSKDLCLVHSVEFRG